MNHSLDASLKELFRLHTRAHTLVRSLTSQVGQLRRQIFVDAEQPELLLGLLPVIGEHAPPGAQRIGAQRVPIGDQNRILVVIRLQSVAQRPTKALPFHVVQTLLEEKADAGSP